jgi:NADH-quinone oxidoreductase subunit L
LMSLPFLLNCIGILICWAYYIQYPAFALRVHNKISNLSSILYKYGLNGIYEFIFAKSMRGLGIACWKVGDQWLIDGLWINGSAWVINRCSLIVRHIQTGYVYHYAFIMILGFLSLMAWLVYIQRI